LRRARGLCRSSRPSAAFSPGLRPIVGGNHSSVGRLPSQAWLCSTPWLAWCLGFLRDPSAVTSPSPPARCWSESGRPECHAGTRGEPRGDRRLSACLPPSSVGTVWHPCPLRRSSPSKRMWPASSSRLPGGSHVQVAPLFRSTVRLCARRAAGEHLRTDMARPTAQVVRPAGPSAGRQRGQRYPAWRRSCPARTPCGDGSLAIVAAAAAYGGGVLGWGSWGRGLVLARSAERRRWGGGGVIGWAGCLRMIDRGFTQNRPSHFQLYPETRHGESEG